MKKICLEIPRDVDYILKKLGDAGHEAYVVGGCVRDALLGRVPNDWDITTSALPTEVKKVFRRTIDTGLQHGTVTVLVGERELGKNFTADNEQAVRDGQTGQAGCKNQRGFEVTTYRIDGAYEDSRHPKEVTFTSNLTEDLKRRDFTINAMAYHPEVGIVDPFDGMSDLEEGVIRAVGDARERFDEDALRIMRAVRFSAQLGFAIDPETALALTEFAPRLGDISHERIRDELLKLITSPYPETFEVLYNMKITREIFPRFDKMMTASPAAGRSCSFGMLALYAMEEVPAEATLRLAALLLHAGDVDSEAGSAEGSATSEAGSAETSATFAKKFLREMRLDNKTIHDVSLLVEQANAVSSFDGATAAGAGATTAGAEISEYDVRLLMNKTGELMPALIELLRADAKGFVSPIREERAAAADRIAALYQKISARGDCVNLGSLAVTGSDLIAAGITPGPELGRLLALLLDEVLLDPTANTKEHLLERAKR